ncbi:MAG TPA: glutamate 5-kinase [Armatimonadetes bacterium]|jgi:glutamate 5-kinase|nr:glutamate 5-kinase [Armatimonadota bacterium]
MDNGQVTERSQLPGCKRIVVKIGTRLITGDATGLNTTFLDSVAQQLAELREDGHEFIIVTSGAVFLGRKLLALRKSEDSTSLRQAAAAAGQPALMRHWSEALSARGLKCGQMLLTRDDMRDRSRYIYLRNTLETLLDKSVIPVINENDSVSIEGITFEENDRLAAMVAATARANLAVFLSDLDGLYTADPRVDCDARQICRVEPDQDHSAAARGAGGPESRGGMTAKLAAAKMLADCGIPAVMASGYTDRVILRIVDGEQLGTFFVPGRPVQGRKLWIATAIHPMGSLIVDKGAVRALRNPDGASLLPIGIVRVVGRFNAGDLVSVVGPDGDEIARGLSNYPSEEVALISGHHTREIPDVLGHIGDDEVVHRDNMVLVTGD